MTYTAEESRELHKVIADIGIFSRVLWPATALRSYQLPAARAIVQAVWARRGESLCVVMARQSGKDELLAQVIAYLLICRQDMGGEIVVATPSLTPQGEMSMDRVAERLAEARVFVSRGVARHGHTLTVGKARVRYLSAGPGANVRGATASLLTIANEAQDIAPDRWDAVFDPMGTSTNSPTVFSGTVWTDDTLLAREMARARVRDVVEAQNAHAQWCEEVERKQGRITDCMDSPEYSGPMELVPPPFVADYPLPTPTLFMADWQAVAATVPAYGARVRRRIAERGADDPFVRTEYLLKPLLADGRLFSAGYLAQMQGEHPRQHAATEGRTYALLVDVGGGIFTPDAGAGAVGGIFTPDADTDADAEYRLSDAASVTSGGHDSTVLTVVEVDTANMRMGMGAGDDGAEAGGDPDPATDGLRPALPVYRVVDRRVWTGAGHLQLAAEIADLSRRVWHGAQVVVDATGIGHGLAAMLASSLGARMVTPFVFTGASKSALGWRLLAAVGAGRYREYADDGADDTRAFRQQAAACTYAVRPGPGRQMQWGVPERAGHDDLLLSAALIGALDDHDWSPRMAVGRGGESN